MTDPEFIFDSLSQAQIDRFDLFARLLQEQNDKYNLTTVRGTDEIRTRHFHDSLAALDVIAGICPSHEPVSLIDIGSGAGFPSLPIAIALPNICVTSLEATAKKVSFQQQVIRQAGIDNANVFHGRAEDMAHDKDWRENFDFATARALAPLAILAELALPFVRNGGHFLAWKGPKCEMEVAQAKKALEILGGRIVEQLPYTLKTETGKNMLRIVVVKKIEITPEKYPRRFKAIKNNPL